MKHPLSLEQVLSFVNRTVIAISPEARDKLGSYAKLIQGWAERQNLISHGDRPHLYERHFLPSFFLLSILDPSPQTVLLDVGSGTGFPVVILKIIYPGLDVTAIDSSRKKCLFLKEVDEELSLDLKVVNQRIEDFNQHNTSVFDYVTSRAAATLSDLWRWVNPTLKVSGKMIALKGGDIHSDIQELKTEGVNCRIYITEKTWTKFSPYLNGKFLVQLERHHD